MTMMTMRNKWMALVSLLVIWASLGVWFLVGTNEPQRVPRKFTSGQPGSGASRGHGNSAARIDLALLMAQRQKGDDSFMAPKNVFRPLKADRETAALSPPTKKRESPQRGPTPPAAVTPPAEAPTVPLAPPLAETMSPVAPVAPPVAPPVPPGPTQEELARQAGRQELAQYRYLGYLIRGGRDEAFLSKGKDLHIVKAGETIDQHVLVKAIAPTGVTLQETASQVEHTVALVP
jgi:hypothetical protein